MTDPNATHRVYTFVTQGDFYNILNEAKRENIFVDDTGKVDIGALLNALCVAFGEGRVAIVPRNGFHPKKETEVKPSEEKPEEEKPKKKKKLEPVADTAPIEQHEGMVQEA